MVTKKDVVHLEEYLYEIPAGYWEDMKVPARLYTDEEGLEDALEDRSVEQLVNTATLPGVVRYALAMPDIHQGYGFPIGGVAAMLLPHGVISPGGIGYDINCGVRLLASNIAEETLRPHLTQLVEGIFRTIPSGLGAGGVKLSPKDLDQVLERGAAWVVSKGYGTRQDLLHCEEQGQMPGAEASAVSQRAKDRGGKQLGSLGSGNHFLEIDQVVAVYDQEVAQRFGLRAGYIAVQVHSGSRGLGHQVCTDYVALMQKASSRYGIKLPDRELVCVPLDSKEGQDYFGAMAAAANFAWANRLVMAHQIRLAFERVLAGKISDWELTSVYDVAHNIGKIEEHRIDGRKAQVCVHRKGATRAFGPGREEVPEAYRDLGQPVLVPGSMGTASYVLVGTEEAMEKTFGSTCHGAGRVLSRTAAKREVRGETLKAALEARGIIVRAGSMPGLAEEAPEAYKDVERVVEVVHRSGLGRKVARLEPMGVVKG